MKNIPPVRIDPGAAPPYSALQKANTREQAKFKKALQDRLGAR